MNIISKFFQHNWWAILYFNFKMLPFKQAIYLPFDFYHNIRFVRSSGCIVLDGPINRFMIKIGSQGSDMIPHTETIVDIAGRWIIKGKFVCGINSLIRIEKNAQLITEQNVTLGANNRVFVEKDIFLSESFLSSWDCQIMDTDTHPIKDLLTGRSSEYAKPIYIGKHTWLGNNVSINKGTKLPSHTIVASNSMCNKDYDIDEYCILAGCPASVVSKNKDWNI